MLLFVTSKKPRIITYLVANASNISLSQSLQHKSFAWFAFRMILGWSNAQTKRVRNQVVCNRACAQTTNTSVWSYARAVQKSRLATVYHIWESSARVLSYLLQGRWWFLQDRWIELEGRLNTRYRRLIRAWLFLRFVQKHCDNKFDRLCPILQQTASHSAKTI